MTLRVWYALHIDPVLCDFQSTIGHIDTNNPLERLIL